MRYANTSAMVGVALMLEVLAILVVVMRFTARRIRAQKLRADDWLILPAIVFGTALVAVDVFSFVTLGKIHDAAKSPDEKVNPADAAHIERAQFSMYVLTAIAMAFIKCSIACLYKRVFVGATFAFVINIFMGVIAVWALAVTLGIIFGCGKHFDGIFPPLDHALCHAYYRMGIGAFATDIALDLVLAILPLPMVWRLQMSWKKRFGVGAIFLVGFLAVGASAGRTAAWILDTSVKGVTFASTTEASIWNLVSVHVGIIVACLPTIGPLFSTLKTTRVMIRMRKAVGAKFAWLAVTFMDEKRSQISEASRHQRSNPLLSSAHASDPEIGAVPSDTEMQPNDVYIRRDMTVEEEQIPQPMNTENPFDV